MVCTTIRDVLHEAKLAFVAQSWPADLNAEILEVMHQATVVAFEQEFFISLTSLLEVLPNPFNLLIKIRCPMFSEKKQSVPYPSLRVLQRQISA